MRKFFWGFVFGNLIWPLTNITVRVVIYKRSGNWPDL